MGDAFICRRGGDAFRALVVVTPPAKTAYYEGEYVNLSGLVLAADFGTFTFPINISDCTYTPTGMLQTTDTAITISVTIGSRTKSASIPITVSEIDPIFGNNPWGAIASIAARGLAGNYWSVGDSKIELGIIYTIIGMNHDSLSSTDAKYNDASYNGGSNKAALTFQIMTSPGQEQMNRTATNIGGWDECYMRNTVLSSYLAGMPADLQGAIRTVDKWTSIGGENNTTVLASHDKLFLPAFSEEKAYNTMDTPVQMREERLLNPIYEYYANRPAYKGQSEWTRSPLNPNYDISDGAHSFLDIHDEDGISNVAWATNRRYYFPAFCI